MSQEFDRSNTIVYCLNWQACVDFYRDILLLETNFKNDWFVEYKINAHAYLSLADSARATIKASGGEGLTLSFHTVNLSDLHEKFTEFDVILTQIKKVWQAQSFFIYDPDGNRIEFWQEIK